jgi:alkanesulfonate monooxygenase SsuD/methylene tetrahydromethanopterin reductase-like flavin-dependent oxidoreductase (luciferase family)
MTTFAPHRETLEAFVDCIHRGADKDTLTRAAASLDLLSGGRVTLAIGAGNYWDSIEAIGGRRLTPRQSVQAVGVSIDVIRAIWDADDPSAAHIDGEYYKVDGAERGPAPAQQIPIVLGAYKSKMLDLVGARPTAGSPRCRTWSRWSRARKRDHRRRRAGGGTRSA